MAVTKTKRSQAGQLKVKTRQSLAPAEKTVRAEFFPYAKGILVEEPTPTKITAPLQALAAAALALPGLLLTPALAMAADDDEMEFGYSHYQEGKREIWVDRSYSQTDVYPAGSIVKAPNVLNPIEADSLFGRAKIRLTDRIRFSANFTQDTWGGATPIASAPVVTGNLSPSNRYGTPIQAGTSPLLHNVLDGSAAMDLHGNFYDVITEYDPTTGAYLKKPGVRNNRLTHTLASASPETRQQGDFKFGYEWDHAALDVGGGISTENDYDSRFGNLGLTLDFNQKCTTVNWGTSYTNSDTHAIMDPLSWQFFRDKRGYTGPADALTDGWDDPLASDVYAYSPRSHGTLHEHRSLDAAGQFMTYDKAILTGNRQDWATTLGLTQLITQNIIMTAGAGFTRSDGFLSNPYKAVYVFEVPVYEANPDPDKPLPIAVGGGTLEIRPHQRNQFTGKLGLSHYLEALDAGLHVNYTVSSDDWGIAAHTFDGDWVQPVGPGWTVTPHIRYYSQSAADFYAPYFVVVQTYDQSGNPAASPYNKALPDYYSSDQRLSGFGALSGGVTVNKQFAKGISLQAGFEYYTHQGSLKLGGGGEQAFADYDYWMANAGLKLNFGALYFGSGSSDDHSHHDPQHVAHALAPAGLMFNHALDHAGDIMAGYRYQRDNQGGGLLSGEGSVDNATALANACAADACLMLPNSMTMNMHMLELMVTPTSWMTLMLMPQWTNMSMGMDHFGKPAIGHSHGGGESGILSHQTGGIGDTGLYALFKVWQHDQQQLVLSLGGTAPTGATDLKYRRNGAGSEWRGTTPLENPLSYSMQLGSGSWDFKPSLTYSGLHEAYSWGAQATATHRLDSRNSEHYVLGDLFQGSVWGGYRWNDWLSSTVRGVYTTQGRVRGNYPDTITADGQIIPYSTAISHRGPENLTGNYGGQYGDLGLGINLTVPSGTFAGHSVKFEWLQPVYTRVNGYQLDRDYTLTATWSTGF